MKRKITILLTGLFFLLCVGNVAWAAAGPPVEIIVDPMPENYVYPGYSNAPDWSADTGYTHQSWDFLSVTNAEGTLVEPPATYAPDARDHGAPTVNAYGTPMYTGTGHIKVNAPDAWIWADHGVAMDCDDYYGMYGGLGHGWVTFSVPNTADAKEAWVQYITYIGGTWNSFGSIIESDPDDMITQFYSDEDGTIENGVMTGRTWEQIPGPAAMFGLWYRVTELWDIEAGSDVDYLYLETPESMSTLFETMDIDTRAVAAPVPVPGALWLFGSGLACLIGFRRRMCK